ncbi:hypothetical protein ES703_66587 [subsurface metagenome]
MQLLDIAHHRLEFRLFVFINIVGEVLANHGAVGGDNDHLQLVYLVKLLGLGEGGAGHARQLFVHAEVVLDGDGGVGAAFLLHLNAFFGFYRLVQAVGVAPTVHQSSGELIDDDDLAVLDHVLVVFTIYLFGVESVSDVAVQVGVSRVVEVGRFE